MIMVGYAVYCLLNDGEASACRYCTQRYFQKGGGAAKVEIEGKTGGVVDLRQKKTEKGEEK